MDAPAKQPRPNVNDAEALFDPGDDTDLGIDDVESEDVGLDNEAGPDDLSPEDFIDESAGEGVRWTDDNEAAGDSIGDDDADASDESEYGWTEGNEPPEALDDAADGIQELPSTMADDGGEEGIEDETTLGGENLADFAPLVAEADEGPTGAPSSDAQVMAEFAAMASAQALEDDPGVVIADGVEWGRHSLGVVHVEPPIRAGEPGAVCGSVAGAIWINAAGLQVTDGSGLRSISWDGLPEGPTAIALPLGATLARDGSRFAVVRSASGLHGPGGPQAYGPLPPLPPQVEHDGQPVVCVVASPEGRRLAAWPGHGLQLAEAGQAEQGWRPKPECPGVRLLASDGERSVALLGDHGLQLSRDGGDSFMDGVDLASAHPDDDATADAIWVCRGFVVVRSERGLIAHGPHGFTRVIDLRPDAVAVVWEGSLPVVYCHVPRTSGGGVLARVELRRTRSPARVLFELTATDGADAPVEVAARSTATGTVVELWKAGQLWTVQLSSGVDGRHG